MTTTAVFKPFYVLANIDVWVEKLPKTMLDMASWKFYCQYGRRHWGALAIQANLIQASNIMKLARLKRMGMDETTNMNKLHALVVFNVSACIDIVPQSLVNHDLVAY